MKTALILEGGAMRGMFTCGVLDVLMQNGVAFDGAAGISAGAVFGCNYKSGQAGRAIRYNKRYCSDPRYCSLRSLITTGDLYGADFCYRELPDELDVFDRRAFRENPMAFYVGATDIDTGECVFRDCLDGSDADAVPCACMEGLGYRRNVIVLTQPKGYRKQPASGQALTRLMLRRYPAVVRAMAVRHEMYNGQMEAIDAREAAGTALVIRPPEPLGIRRTEKRPEELERVYRIGVREAEKRLEAVKAFLAATHDERRRDAR